MARLYKNIQAYNLSYNFVLDLYRCTNTFPKYEEHTITSQIRRASVSIPLNIAEGSAKASHKEFLHFLNTAYASAKEVEVLLELSRDLKYLDDDAFTYLANRLDEVNAKLFLFIRNIESRISGRKYHFFKEFQKKTKDELF